MVLSTLLAFIAIALVGLETSSDMHNGNLITMIRTSTVTDHGARPLVFRMFATSTGFGEWDANSIVPYDCLAFDAFQGFQGYTLSFPPRPDVLNYNFTKRCIDYPIWHRFPYSLVMYEPSVPFFPKNASSILKINFRVPPFFGPYLPYVVFFVANGTLADLSVLSISSVAYLRLGHSNVVLMSETVHTQKDGAQVRNIWLKAVATVPQELPEANYSNTTLVLSWETNTVLDYEDNDSVNSVALTSLLLGVVAVVLASLAYFVDLMEYFANRKKKQEKMRKLPVEEDNGNHSNLSDIGDPSARVEAQT